MNVQKNKNNNYSINGLTRQDIAIILTALQDNKITIRHDLGTKITNEVRKCERNER